MTKGRVVREEDSGQDDDGRMNGDRVDEVRVGHVQGVGHGVWCALTRLKSGIRVIYGRSHIYLNLGICLGCKIQESDLALFVDVIDVHVYFWCHSLVLIFYHIA